MAQSKPKTGIEVPADGETREVELVTPQTYVLPEAVHVDIRDAALGEVVRDLPAGSFVASTLEDIALGEYLTGLGLVEAPDEPSKEG